MGGKHESQESYRCSGSRRCWRSASGGQALAQSAAERAVEAAKQYAGTEITIVWEAGLQALDPLNFSGPASGRS